MKVCFVGVGSIGKRHIRNLVNISKRDGLKIQIHALRHSKRDIDDFSKEYITKEIYDADMLDQSYDAVFITNPTNLHFETIKLFKEKSDCFFIEKPLFDNCNTKLTEIKKKEGLYYVACPLRHTGIIKYAHEIIKKENIINARAMCSSYLPDWRPGQDYRKTYSAHRSEGGGVLIDLIHEWDYLTSLFGFPQKISMMSGKYSDLEIDSDDLAVYIADYGDKLIELHLDYIGRINRRNLELFTNDSLYEFDIINQVVKKNGETIKKFEEDVNDKYIREMEYFLELIKRKCDNINSMENALKVIKIANK